MKNTWIKLLTMAGVFVIIATVLIVIVLQRQGANRQYTDRATATIPTISFLYDNVVMNELNGYLGVTEEEHYYMRGMLLPLLAERKTVLRINKHESEVKSLRYRVYDGQGARLYEDKSIPLAASGGTSLDVELTLSNLILPSTECRLYLYLELEDGREVFYATRAIYEEKHFLSAFMTTSGQITRALLTKDTTGYQQYLTFTEENAQNNLSVVSLRSTSRQATWAGLTPKIVSERTLRLYELSRTQASFSWCYTVETFENDRAVYYDVEEYYSMRDRDGKTFVLDYERKTREQFAKNGNCMGTTSILLGIQERKDVDMLKTSDNKKVVFQVNNTIQFYHYTNNEMTEIFAFDTHNANLQNTSDMVQLRLLNLSEDGDLVFTVLGYYSSGNHEGTCGLGLYRYTFGDNSVEEIAFIPTLGSYEWTFSQCGKVLALNSKGLFYFDFGSNLCALDTDSAEYQVMAEKLPFDLKISKDMSVVAWDDAAERSLIHILDMENNQSQKLSLPNNEITTIGFVGHDIVYGIYAKDMAKSEIFDNANLMRELRIVNLDLEEQAVYSKAGVYITKAVAEDSSVRIAGVRRKATGVWENMPEDVLTSYQPPEKAASVELKISSSNMKYNYYYITFSKAIPTSHLLGRRDCRFRYEDSRVIDLNRYRTLPDYRSYYAGRITKYSNLLAEAIDSVFDKMGVVMKNQTLIWNRDARNLYVTLTMPKTEAILGNLALHNSVEASLEAMRLYAMPDKEMKIGESLQKGHTVLDIAKTMFGDKLVDLSGATTAQILYYINERHPVFAMIDEKNAVLVCAYNSNSLFLFDPITGEKTSYALSQDADAIFDKAGYMFFSYIK